jgi:hypothetical protein
MSNTRGPLNSADPTTSVLVGGVYNEVAPAPADQQPCALQVDNEGNLLVNVAVGGGGSGGTVKIEDTSGNALNSNGSGALNVAVVSGGGSNSSVGSNGAATPTSSTAIGGSDGTNLQQALVESAAHPNLRTAIYNGATEVAVTVANALKVDGSASTQPISGTVATNADTTIGGTSAPSKELLVAGKTNDGTPQYQPIPEGTGGRSVIVEGVSGGTAIPVSGTVAVTESGAWNVNQTKTTPGYEAITDGTNGPAAVKAASTAAATTDPSLVVQINPGQPNLTTALNVETVSGSTTAVTQSTASNLKAEAMLLDSAGTNLGTIKAASTASAATDTSLVTQINPEQPNLITPLNVFLVPQTSGGLSVATGSIGATATSVKASAGQVFGWYIYNSNTSVAYVQFFNLATGSVTLGTTTPFFSLGIPAGSGANVLFGTGIAFGTAITIAITTTRAGSTGPTNTVDYNIFYL